MNSPRRDIILEIPEMVKNSQIGYLELSDEGGIGGTANVIMMNLAAFPPRIAGGPPAKWVGVLEGI